ncbi:MAG: orotidine 5'-phosphate decarboxylase, partial [Candidatus Aminicenantes bacterium]|nr:orotidine 5'-phosphate decarboxylase [Candidatus Aminicenantes bacterium]
MNNRIIIALDVDDFQKARLLVDHLHDATLFKVGLQAFLKFGNELIGYLREKDKKVFLDL